MAAEFKTLLDDIYRSMAEPSLWPDTLVKLSDYLGAIGGMIIYNAPPGGRNLMITGRLDEEKTEIFHRYHVWNPWTLAMRHVPFDRATVSGSLVDRRIVHKTAFYADVLEPQGIADMLCASHLAMAHDGGVGGFGFALSMGATEQADVAARKFQRVLPHLSRALDSAMKFGGLADGTRQLTRVMALMPNPALLLDSSGRIITANPAAELLLRNGDGLTSDAVGVPQLSAALPSEKRALSRALAQALAIASGTDDKLAEPLRLTRPSGAPPLLVLIIPLPPPAFSLWEMLGAARVMVLAVDPAAQAIASTATVCSAFGLTNAEARVALLIAGGFSGPQTAAALGISPQTVKTHLRRCFEKTGVHSQVGLARLFAGLPATD